MNQHLFLAACFDTLLAILVAGWALSRRRQVKGASIFAVFAIEVALWCFFYALWQLQTDRAAAEFYCRILMMPAGLLGISMLRAAYAYADIKEPVVLALMRIAGWTNLVLCLVPGMVVDGMMENVAGVRWWPHAGPAFLLFLFTFNVGFVRGVWLMASKLLRSPTSRPEGVRLIAGTLIGYIGGFTNLPAWYYPHLPAIPPYGQSLVCVFLVFMAATYLEARATALSPRTIRYVAVLGVAMLLTMTASAVLQRYQVFAGVSALQEIALLFVIALSVVIVVSGAVSLMRSMVAGVFSPSLLITERLLEDTQREVRTSTRDTLGARAAESLGSELGAERVAIYLPEDDGVTAMLLGAKGPAKEFVTISRALVKQMRQHKKFFHFEAETPSPEGYVFCSPVFEDDNLRLFVLIGRHTSGAITGPIAAAIDATSLAIYAHLRVLKAARDEAASMQLRELGAMAASLAHDFRNPLTTVKLYVSEPVEDEAAEQVRQQAVVDLKRMEAAVSSVLEFADTKGQIQAHDIAEVMDKIASLTQTEMNQAGVRFINDVPAKTIYIRAPFHMLITLFSQFFKNSAKALKQNRVRNGEVHVFGAVMNNEAVIAVADNGPGVPEAIRARLFTQMVTTERDQSSTRTTGFGIGLLSAGAITRRLGGRISYEPFRGRMAFVVRLPLGTKNESAP